jgi:hypothetical protein
MSQSNINAYLNTHQQLLQAVQGLSLEQITWKAAPEAWSVTEVLAHLADHNIVVSFRIRDILAGTNATLPAFKQDEWVSGQKANDGSAKDILQLYGELLRYNGLLLSRLSEEDWKKSGVNIKGDIWSISDIVKGFTKHVNTHLAQIERIKGAFGAA